MLININSEILALAVRRSIVREMQGAYLDTMDLPEQCYISETHYASEAETTERDASLDQEEASGALPGVLKLKKGVPCTL